MKLVDLISRPILLDRLNLLLRRYFVVLVVEFDQVGVALLYLRDLDLLLVAILLPLRLVSAHLRHGLSHGVPHPGLWPHRAVQEIP
jgi:hypothetical protein